MATKVDELLGMGEAIDGDDAQFCAKALAVLDEIVRLRSERRKAKRARPEEKQPCQHSEKAPESSSTGSPSAEGGESSPYTQMADELLSKLEAKPLPTSSQRVSRRS
jgi:hypothetical protein